MPIIQHKSKKRHLKVMMEEKKRNLEFGFPCYDGREGETRSFWYGHVKRARVG
jgi:hypothetical protein